MAPKVIIQYPRTCDACGSTYTQRTNFSRHLSNGVCERKRAALERRDLNPSITNTSNLQNNNQININIVQNNNYFNSYKDPMNSRQEQKQIIEVLDLLKDKGYVTKEDVQKFIMEEFISLQDFVEVINNYSLDVLRNIVDEIRKNDKSNNLDEQMKDCVIKLFNRLILNTSDDPYITPDTLKSNPLHKSKNGQLSAWSATECKECPSGYATFGVPTTSMKKWISLQDEGTWKPLIDVISNRYIRALQSQKDLDSYFRDSNDTANIELAEYWENSMMDNKYTDIVKELCRDLMIMSRKEVNTGWYNLTKLAAAETAKTLCIQ